MYEYLLFYIVEYLFSVFIVI